MKNSLITCTAGLSVQLLTWNAVALTATSTSTYVSLASLATFVPTTVAVVSEGTSSYYSQFYYRLAVGSGVLPAWIVPGVAVSIAASVTISGKSYTLSGEYIVRDVDTTAGLYFDVFRPKVGASDTAVLGSALAVTNLDNGQGAVPSATVTLIMQAQKAMFQCTSGSVLLAPVADFNNNAPYSVTLTPLSSGGNEYEVTAQVASKYDLKDWKVKAVGGTSVLAVRFL